MLRVEDYVFHFGKHKGERIDEVPASYLLWLAEQAWCEKKFPSIIEYVNLRYKDLLAESERDED